MAEATIEDEVLELAAGVAAETKAEFREDPTALPEEMRGNGRRRRTGEITIFLDGVAGEEHEKVQQSLDMFAGALAHAQQVGDDEATAKIREQYDAIEAKAEELKAALLNDAYTFELRALPPVIMKGLRREVRAELGITTKGIPAELEERYDEVFPLRMIEKQAVKFIDHGTSPEPTTLAREKLQEIYEWGDEFQWLRLTNLANDLQFRNTIAQSVIESPDF